MTYSEDSKLKNESYDSYEYWVEDRTRDLLVDTLIS